jgi:prepilin-type N-terminal cleavage/methylation domain-containing protein
MKHKLKLLLLKSLHPYSVKHPKNTEAGFNLLEVITVVIILGILSAIVAPAWDAFVSRQRLRNSQNTVFQAMQSAHSAARGTRSSWQVSFKTENDDDGNPRVWVGLHPANVPPGSLGEVGEAAGVTENAWYPLAEGIQIEDATLVEVNAQNELGNGDFSRILFNYSGCPIFEDGQECTEAVDDIQPPIILTMTHKPLGENAQRCVRVETLIGSMRTAEGVKGEDDNLCE